MIDAATARRIARGEGLCIFGHHLEALDMLITGAAYAGRFSIRATLDLHEIYRLKALHFEVYDVPTSRPATIDWRASAPAQYLIDRERKSR